MNNKELIQKSKFLSLVLRHKPEEIGIKLDAEGWANTQELCRLSHITRTELDEIVDKNNKKRFEYGGHKDKIRACQGHSIDVDLKLEPKEPPNYLYHGTSDRFLESIKKEGLKPQDRNHVHLSLDRETAEKVGQRNGGNTIVLKIRAGNMQVDEFDFYQSANGVWLTDNVPVDYIAFPVEIKFKNTNRGFGCGEFTDRNGAKCSIQESSLATEAAIWLGCDNADPKECISGKGWVNIPMPAEYVANTRMHLTVEMAEALIPLLQKFVKTGGLK
jgi:putative RNA 2'-phosphotransferase